MDYDFPQLEWNAELEDDLRRLLDLALREDLGDRESGGIGVGGDLTSEALVPADARGEAAVVARGPGVIAGLPTVRPTIAAIDPALAFNATVSDGDRLHPGAHVGLLSGPARSMLAAERLILNLLGRLSGIATLTAQYVAAVAETGARIYDTRKTTPGWRRLEKYAVRCGGGCNHRLALFSAVLIKDNHLALGGQPSTAPDARSLDEPTARGAPRFTPAEAVRHAREFLEARAGARPGEGAIVEVEVDSLAQLREVLPAGPDMVLLDNMAPAELVAAVEARDAVDGRIELEASGGVNLESVGRIAATGVDRISVGALTHSVASLDLGLDWL